MLCPRLRGPGFKSPQRIRTSMWKDAPLFYFSSWLNGKFWKERKFIYVVRMIWKRDTKKVTTRSSIFFWGGGQIFKGLTSEIDSNLQFFHSFFFVKTCFYHWKCVFSGKKTLDQRSRAIKKNAKFCINFLAFFA